MRILVSVIVFLLTGGSCFAIPLDLNKGGAVNRHNLSSNSFNAHKAQTDTRICVFCHTPHGASAQSALWNRKDPKKTSFPLYNDLDALHIDDAAISSVSQYTTDTGTYPNGATRMCLSCHDGVSAVGEVLSSSTKIASVSEILSGNAVIDLATSHPVSFVYTPVVVAYINSTIGVDDYKSPTDVPLDGNDRMQCTTCHDPHEDTRVGNYNLPFWRKRSGTDAAAALVDYDTTCLECHSGNQWTGSWGTNHKP